MAEATLRMSFRQLVIRVADFLSVADYSGASLSVPSDSLDLDLCKKLVNDGYRRLIGAHEWKWLTAPISLTFQSGTVAADDSRYFLPAGFAGQLMTPWVYQYDGSGSPLIQLVTVDETVIRDLWISSQRRTGDPTHIAHRPLTVATVSGGQRWEAIVHPIPTDNHTITAKARIYPDAMTETGLDTEFAISGAAHDQTLLALSLAEAERTRDERPGPMWAYAQEMLATSLKYDRETGPRRLGLDYGDKTEHRVRSLRPWYSGVDSYGGVTIDDAT